MTLTGYHLRPSSEILKLHAEFPDFLICELHGVDSEITSYVATSTRTGSGGQPELIVTASAGELRKAMSVLGIQPGGGQGAEPRGCRR
ncbi:hypothetical protein NE857_08845 [Nocardiopsis exhalans]|uniref:Uncharacterized protein n=1 Tax=Nocardiopsis exhalans TaxID=163604 RepID=A0ABY5DBG9_9ACTN|nr:hypothetical protein [Nocardiopsis exhalans]USY21691.1 hypothetical protein NE857_08845 [Nocardiopsis exhalans]